MNEHANILTPSKQSSPAAVAHDVAEPALEKEQQQLLPIQCSLTVGAPDDPLEDEADTMADTVMRMPLTPLSLGRGAGGEAVQRKCASCEEEEKIQRKPLSSFITPFIQTKSNGEATTSTALTSRINNSRGSGTSMDSETKSFMESRFGSDFSNVKIHTGSESVMMNRELSAKAFTVGNDIYFNEGQYNPNSNSGKHLLAHELTHTIQQEKNIQPEKIQRACNQDFSAYTGESCQGTIQVGATTISPPVAGYYHLFILYTDHKGYQFYFRGGPLRNGPDYGPVIVLCNPYVEGEVEYDTANLLTDVYSGADACNKLNIMKAHLNEIESWHIPYVPAGPNSNSVIATLLTAAGLPHNKPSVPTPGFDMVITPSGPAPSTGEHPTTLLGGIGGGNGLLLNAELQQRLATPTPEVGGIPIPLPLLLQMGIYGMPDAGRLGGSVGLGTNLSLFNLPVGRHSPLGIDLGAGVTGGAAGLNTPDTDPEVGAYTRLGIYADFAGRFRVGTSWQYNFFHNTDTGTNANIHNFLLQTGYTF